MFPFQICLFPFSFQFLTRLAAVFAEEVSGFGFVFLLRPNLVVFDQQHLSHSHPHLW